MSLFTNKESVSLIQGKALLYMKRRPSRMEKGVSLYQQNAFFAMKRCFHQMKRILKSRDRCLRLSLLMALRTKVLYTIDTHLSLSVINVSSTNSEQYRLCIHSPLYIIDARLLWKQTICSNCP